jgi:hypothetical protein
VRQIVNDIILMDSTTKLQIPPNKTQIFNNWRLYFQVISLSDITSPCGSCIKPKYFDKKKCQDVGISNRSKIRWPNQQMPCLKTFNIWKSIISEIGQVTIDGKLRNKLGNWTVNPSIYRKYSVLMHTSTNQLIKQYKQGQWAVVERSHQMQNYVYYRKTPSYILDATELSDYIPVECVSEKS